MPTGSSCTVCIISFLFYPKLRWLKNSWQSSPTLNCTKFHSSAVKSLLPHKWNSLHCSYLICLKTLWHMAKNHLVCCESFQFSHSGVVEDYVNPSFLSSLANAIPYFQTKYFTHVRQIFGCEGEATRVNIAICSWIVHTINLVQTPDCDMFVECLKIDCFTAVHTASLKNQELTNQ